jgi:hypothetical protein
MAHLLIIMLLLLLLLLLLFRRGAAPGPGGDSQAGPTGSLIRGATVRRECAQEFPAR